MNILIAHKSTEVRENLKAILSKIFLTSQIHETKSNLEAVSKLFQYYPNLIITDVDLYDGTGLGFLSFATSLRPKALIIVFTSLLMYDLKTVSLKMGADYYLNNSDDFTFIKEILIQQEDRFLYA